MSELRTIVLIWTLLLTMAITAGIGARHRGGAAALALVSLVWLLVNSSEVQCCAVAQWVRLSRFRRRE